jgi:hypothetical protein
MDIIYQERQTGKTTELIKRADKNNGIIVVNNSTQGRHLLESAETMRCQINNPITYKQFIDGEYPNDTNCFFIDDAESIFSALTSVPINTIVINNEELI